MDAKKTDVLNKIFLNTFENIKKNLNKKDPYYNKVKTAFGNIKENHPDSQTNEGIKYNLTLMISTLETRIIKIIEKVLSTLDQIISLDVIDYKILQEKVPSILENLFAKSNIGDDNINYKILNLCLIMYSNKNIRINGMNLINLIKICLNVFLLTKNSNCQNASKSTLIQVIDLIIEKVENAIYASSLNNNRFSYTNNNYLGNFSNKLTKIDKDQNYKNQSSNVININKKDSQNEFKTTALNKNDFAVSIQHKHLAEKYMNFYLDILEINNLIDLKNNNNEKEEVAENATEHIQTIDNSFLLALVEQIQKPTEAIVFSINENEEKESCSSNSNTINSNKIPKFGGYSEARNTSLKSLFENLHLDNFKIRNESENQIGKFGWCIYCRKQSPFFSDIIHFPICSNECEKEMIKLTKSVKIDLNIETSENETTSSITEMDNYREDYINTVKILSKLSIKETKQQNNIEEINLRLRELCLELIQLLLVKGAKYFNQEIKLLQVIKESTVDSLVKNSMSNEMNIFKLSVNLFLTIISYYREYLKNEIEIFINKVLIAILESENLGFVYKEIILDALLKIADNGNFLVEIYTNYDCDINHKNVFYEIINLMTKIINGLYKKPKYYNTFKNNQEATLRIKCLEFLSNFIKSLSLLVEENNEISNSNNINNNNINNNNNLNTLKNSINQKGNPSNNNILTLNRDGNQTIAGEVNTINQSEFYSHSHYNNLDEDLNVSTIDSEIKDKINYNLKMKSIITKAVEKFNYNPSNCFNYLKAHNLLPSDQMFSEIKKKLLQDLEQNDQEKLSDYLGGNNQNFERENPSNGTNYSSLFFIPNSNMNYLTNLDKDQLLGLTFEDFYAREIAIFLKLNLKDINKQSLGGFLGGAKPLNQKILEFFIDSYNFKNFHILEAMRILFSDFNLVGEGQIVDRIVKFFGQKYHKDNPTTFKIPDVAYYLAFSIMLLQTDLHRPEVEKKMSPQVFINNFNLVCKDGVEDSVLIDVYNRVLNDPIRFPGQKLYSNKNKKDLIKLEKESILKSTYEELHIKNYGNTINSVNPISHDNYNSLNTISNNYITSIDNDHVRNLLDATWSNFLGIFSQLLADFEEENIVVTCIDNILSIGKMCGILGLETISEAFINTIINITNIMEGREIKKKNFECTKAIIEFAIQSGNYIRSSWYNILTIISKIDYYHTIGGQFKNEAELFAKEIRRKSRSKNPEREIEIEAKNTEIICNNISLLVCDNVFSKTSTFDLEGITSFISALCLVSKNELDHFFNPRNYSLHKLVEVADFNIFRIQIEWSKIWKLISDHLIYVASNYNHDNICIDAIDLLRQTVSKLLQKPDLMAYNFQIEFFRPFEIIFNQSINRPDRSELILTCIAFIVQNSKNINSGWILIFNILKNGMKRKDAKLNSEILKIFQIINDDFSLMNNSSINHEVFRGYIECLCHMYLEENLKKLAFDTIIKLISKIFNNTSTQSLLSGNAITGNNLNPSNNYEFNSNSSSKEHEDQRSVNLLGTSHEKKFEFLKIFFYGFDDLLRINVIEHLNLLFEVISYNKDFIFSSDINSFIYLYFSYFKPHIVSLILNYYDYRLAFFDTKLTSIDSSNDLNKEEKKTKILNRDSLKELKSRKDSNNKGNFENRMSKSFEFSNTKVFEDFYSKNTFEDIYHNIKTYLETSLNNLIINLEEENNFEIRQQQEEKDRNKNKANIITESETTQKKFEGNENIPQEQKKSKSNLFELNNNGGGDTRVKIIQFLKQMFKCYDKDTDLIIKKLEILKSFDINNYEISIEFFIEKFFNMIHKNSDSYMNYKFFFEDLLITIFNLSTFNKYPEVLFKIIGKNILFNGGLISDNCWNYLLDNICYKLKSLANIKNNISQENISNIISFFTPFSNLLRDLFVNYFDKLSQFSNKNKGLVNEYNYINLIFCRFLRSDIIKLYENNKENNKTENSEEEKNYHSNLQIYEILKILSKIKYLILEKTNLSLNNFLNRNSIIELLNSFESIYTEMKLSEIENNEIIDLMQFEIQYILPRFILYFKSEDLELVFTSIINFIDSRNSSLRNSSKYLINQFVKKKLIKFKQHDQEIEKTKDIINSEESENYNHDNLKLVFNNNNIKDE